MLLCDIGNSSYHFYDGFVDYKEITENFNPASIKQIVYYISVNARVSNIIDKLENWIDLSIYIDRKNYYQTIGIDRIFACEAVDTAMVIDAGSAITVDIVNNGIYKGGFIYPGVRAMSKTYKDISLALDYSFNFELELDKMPKNSRDSISYGYLKLLYNEVVSHNMDIVLTGGDAKKLVKLFPNATIDNLLIFHGMNKIIKKANLC